ncbi:hypothetical protein KAJ89_01875 [Candidatus Parcubacteria bacterium]|nr:hypothetical protein [Candidatus Parcubacteria bacterium]
MEHIPRIQEELENSQITDKRKITLLAILRTAHSLATFCAENKIGAFEAFFENRIVSNFSAEKLPKYRDEYNDENTPEERKKVLRQAMDSARRNTITCNEVRAGAFESKTPLNVITIALRPF